MQFLAKKIDILAPNCIKILSKVIRGLGEWADFWDEKWRFSPIYLKLFMTSNSRSHNKHDDKWSQTSESMTWREVLSLKKGTKNRGWITKNSGCTKTVYFPVEEGQGRRRTRPVGDVTKKSSGLRRWARRRLSTNKLNGDGAVRWKASSSKH